MARKSRVASAAPCKAVIPKEGSIHRAAGYVRLSHERADTMERGTIENQVGMIRDYIGKQDGLTVTDIYVDDSVSGTTFDRPGFDRLISDMKRGRFDTLVVKDLSRLGRDYIETGNLIERVFPLYGIRFISITDNYDSEKGGMELMTGVANIANALYAQDISRKIISSKNSRMERGIPVGSVPYGYRTVTDGSGERRMVVDDEAAETVRRIFSEYLSGSTQRMIADMLNADGVPSPFRYRYRNKPEMLNAKSCAHLVWTLDNVSHVLKNEVYTGKYVMGKDRKCLFRHEDRHMTGRDEWLVFEDHHEAVISGDDFARARAMGRKQVTKRERQPNFFKGKVTCGCCGSSMCDCPDKGRRYYLCTHKRRYGKESCTSSPVVKGKLYEAVFLAIKEALELFIDEDRVMDAYRRSSGYRDRTKALRDAKEDALSRLKELEERKSSLYLDLRDGVLDESEYLAINRGYTEKMSKLEESLKELSESLSKDGWDPLDEGGLREKVKIYVGQKELTQEMVDAFVKRVIVHEGKNVEVILDCDDELQAVMKRRKEREGKTS